MPTTGTGVIKGRVVDGVSGAPIARARVRLQGGASQRPSVLTDAAGSFVFKNLPVGIFTLSVDKSTYLPARYPESGRTLRSSAKPLLLQAGQSVDSIVVPVFRGGAITGRVLDASGDLVEGAEVRLMRVASGSPTMRNSTMTNDLGEYRLGKLDPGTYLVMASARRFGQEEPAAPNTEPAPQPVPSYYPGVSALDLAQPLRVERGQTLGDIDITLGEGVPAVVSGTVVGEDGQSTTGGAFVMARTVMKDMPYPFDAGGTSVRPDGTFRLTVPPGEYLIEARANAPGGMTDRMGMLRLTVSGSVDGISIVVGRAASATGKVVFEGSNAIPPNPQQMQFQLFTSEGMTCRSGRMSIAADWTFTLDGLAGTCSLSSQSGLGGWMLASVHIDGEPLGDQPVTFEPGQRLKNVQVVFTDRRPGVTFRVTDETGQTTRDYVGLVFPAAKGAVKPSTVRTLVPPSDEMLATMIAAYPSRATPATLRREVIQGLRPGDYYAIAIDDIATEDARDPLVITRLTPAATRITVAESGDTQVTLRRQKLADIVK